jgi:uncharacterized protein (TIGR02594 family)
VNDPAWLTEGFRYNGLKEIPGPRHESVILRWLEDLRAWWTDDETPWCGVFVAHCVKSAGHPLPRYWMRAQAWLEWGQPIDVAARGAVVVFSRQGGGHVGFVVGRDARGNLLVLGGNQGNAVSIAPFERSRVLGFRWPAGEPLPPVAALPTLALSAPVSRNEA